MTIILSIFGGFQISNFSFFELLSLDFLKSWKVDGGHREMMKMPVNNLQHIANEFQICQKTWNGNLVTFLFSSKGIPSHPQHTDFHASTPINELLPWYILGCEFISYSIPRNTKNYNEGIKNIMERYECQKNTLHWWDTKSCIESVSDRFKIPENVELLSVRR